MKFALLATNLAGGGAERSIVRLATALRQRGHDVRLILLEERVDHDPPADVPLHVLVKQASKGTLGAWLASVRVRRLYRKLGLGTDCLTVSTLPFADRVAAMAGVPNLWCRITNTLSAEIEALRRTSPRKAERRLARYQRLYDGRNLVAVSDGMANDLRTNIGLSRARIVRIYNGFDIQAISRAALDPEPEMPKGPFVLHVGRFMPQKRHDLLFDAWRRAALPHKLVLLARPEDALTRLIERHGLAEQILVAGFRSNPYPWIRAAELLVLCSDREGMPNVLVEALACGTRVVSTDCPSGPAEVLRGDLARWLVPCGDAEALAAKMREALAVPRPAAGTVPREFSDERMLEGYESLFALSR